MSKEELELLITTDDPGEDTLEEDTFHHPTEKTGPTNSDNGGDTTS